MHRMILALMVFSVAACQRQASPLSDADVAAIRNLGPQFSQAILAKDVDAVVAMYTDDAVLMPPGAPVVVGKDAIRDYFTAQFASDVVTTEQVFTSIQTEGEGNQAFDRGTFMWKGTRPGASDPITEVGKYVVIVRRTADGSWRVAVDIGNSDPRPPEPE
jgi:uncharacterized protein (TIGR02246 family)